MMYTFEQKKMMQKGYTLCVECQKGHLGDKSCGANGAMNLPPDMPSGCLSGKKINDVNFDKITSESSDIQNLLDNTTDNQRIIETKIYFNVLTNIDYTEYKNICSDIDDIKQCEEELKKYFENKMRKFHSEIVNFASKIKSDKQVICGCSIKSKSFSIKEKLAECICDILKKIN